MKTNTCTKGSVTQTPFPYTHNQQKHHPVAPYRIFCSAPNVIVEQSYICFTDDRIKRHMRELLSKKGQHQRAVAIGCAKPWDNKDFAIPPRH
jgi:hypothetical protein